MTKDTNLNIRVSPEMKARIQAAAKDYDMTISAWLLMVARQAIVKQDAERFAHEVEQAAREEYNRR